MQRCTQVCLRPGAGTASGSALQYPDLGYAFLDEYTGLGYASEAAKCVIQYSLDILELNYLCALTDPENNTSINLLKKCGFSFITLAIFNEGQGVTNLYGIELKLISIE